MNILFPLMLVLMIVGFYFMIIKPQKKRQAEA
ncbi:MAG: Preprotein translocase subunit, partial [Actinomycetota bacterium]|nr:Preprotein translocase subunit [Actinomycetota bacterium]